jgi:tRNA(Ile)-lysidine synthase
MAEVGVGPNDPIAVGLSGGGDSVALTLLLRAWGATPTALIVDHGLRSSSRAEAAKVSAWAQKLGLKAQILRRRGSKPTSNIEDEARAARYRLLGDWCREHVVERLLIAHTSEDQAETFLLRLGRGSGMDGLAAMAASSPFPRPGYGSLRILRPLLGFGRDELRAYATAKGAAWIEDPMNADPRFARTRMRRLLPLLDEAGVPVTRIVQAAQHASRARAALEAATQAFLDAHVRFDGDVARLDAPALGRQPREIGLRALASVLGRVSGQEYRPRFERLERLFDALGTAGPFAARTLHGCRVAPSASRFKDFGPGTVEVAPERSRQRRQP